MTESLAARLGAWAAGLRFEDIPEPVVETARRCLLDTYGVMLAGRRRPVARQALALVAPTVDGASLPGLGLRASPAAAAFANGVAAHALDFDDTCFAGVVHGSAVILPALLARAEAAGSSGRELVTAFVAASEVAYALGACVGRRLYDAGWWPTGCLAPIGAAAGAARLAGGSAETVAWAIALAACQASGFRVIAGSDAKPYLVGRAAQTAVEAAAAAAHGLQGPADVLEGRHGFFAMLAGGAADPEALRALGRIYRLLDPGIVVKAFPLCSCAQAPVEALLAILAGEAVPPDQVARIDCAVMPMVAATLTYDRPASAAEAQFSLPFALAVALARGRVAPADVAQDALADPGLAALMEKVGYAVDPALAEPEAHPEAARVTVTLRDGRRHQRLVRLARGDPRRPLEEAALEDKFLACAGMLLAPEAAGACLEALRGIERLSDLGALTAAVG